MAIMPNGGWVLQFQVGAFLLHGSLLWEARPYDPEIQALVWRNTADGPDPAMVRNCDSLCEWWLLHRFRGENLFGGHSCKGGLQGGLPEKSASRVANEQRIAPCPNREAQWCASHPGTSRREPGLACVDFFHGCAEPDARRRRHGRGRIVTVNCTERRQGDSKVRDTEVVTT